MGTERPIVVHQLNATGVSPAEFIRIVAATGCKLVTLFTFDGGDQVPRSNTGLSYPQPVTPQNKAETLAALAETGVAVDGIEFFPLTEEVDLEIYVPALAMGANSAPSGHRRTCSSATTPWSSTSSASSATWPSARV